MPLAPRPVEIINRPHAKPEAEFPPICPEDAHLITSDAIQVRYHLSDLARELTGAGRAGDANAIYDLRDRLVSLPGIIAAGKVSLAQRSVDTPANAPIRPQCERH